MDVLLWIGWPCTLVVLLFLVAIAVFGSLALRSPLWDAEFQALAYRDWMRRGLLDRTRSESEELQMRRFIGDGRAAQAPDPADRTRIVRTIGVLVGENDSESLQAQLDERSQVLLEAALEAVFASVSNIANLDIASRVWSFRRRLALAVVLWRGLVWFAPRCFRSVSTVAERYLVVATILGITGGLLVWGFTHKLTDPGDAGIAWMTFVGVVVTVGTVVALVLAVGRQFWRITVTVIGPRTWTAKGIATAALGLVVVFALLTLNQVGVLQQWQLDANTFVAAQLREIPAGHWIGGILSIALIGYLVIRALRRAQNRGIKMRNRVQALGGAGLLALIGVLVVVFVVGAPSDVALPMLYLTAVALMLCGMGQAVFDVFGWFAKYRVLRDAGVDVRQGWFRWWLLWTWIASAVVLASLTSIPSVVYTALQATPYFAPYSIVTALVTFALFLSFWPGLFAVACFALRVHNRYVRYEFESSNARFEATLKLADSLEAERGREDVNL